MFIDNEHIIVVQWGFLMAMVRDKTQLAIELLCMSISGKEYSRVLGLKLRSPYCMVTCRIYTSLCLLSTPLNRFSDLEIFETFHGDWQEDRKIPSRNQAVPLFGGIW